MHITNLEKAKKIKPDMKGAKGIYKQAPISKEDGAPTFSFRVFTVEPGRHSPFHEHPFEHLNYVIEGHGKVLLKDGECEVKKGDFALVAPSEKHQYQNTSKGELFIFICAVPKEYE